MTHLQKISKLVEAKNPKRRFWQLNVNLTDKGIKISAFHCDRDISGFMNVQYMSAFKS